MTWAVHNIHSPSVLVTSTGYTHDGSAIIKTGAPLFEAETEQEAEDWRRERVEGLRNGRL